MLHLLASDWTVRFFLVYLVLVGGLTLFRRPRLEMPSSLNFLVLTNVNDPRMERWIHYGQASAKEWCIEDTRIGFRRLHDSNIWKKADDNSLRYA